MKIGGPGACPRGVAEFTKTVAEFTKAVAEFTKAVAEFTKTVAEFTKSSLAGQKSLQVLMFFLIFVDKLLITIIAA